MRRFEQLLRKQYAFRRGHLLPEEVDLLELSRLASTKALDALRGSLTIRVSRPHGPFFRGAGVRLSSPRKIVLGVDVVLNRRVSIEASGRDGVRLGNRVTVGENARILSSGVIREPGVGIRIGDDTAIGMDNLLWGQGGITIGSSCLLGPRVSIFSENHATGRRDVPIRSQGTVRGPVSVADDCWIGAASVIVAGVRVGEGAVIAAGAVVTRDVPPFAVVAGVPARIIGSRGQH